MNHICSKKKGSMARTNKHSWPVRPAAWSCIALYSWLLWRSSSPVAYSPRVRRVDRATVTCLPDPGTWWPERWAGGWRSTGLGPATIPPTHANTHNYIIKRFVSVQEKWMSFRRGLISTDYFVRPYVTTVTRWAPGASRSSCVSPKLAMRWPARM